MPAETLPIVPLPQLVESRTGVFRLTPDSMIYPATDNAEIRGVCLLFAELMEPQLGFRMRLQTGELPSAQAGVVEFHISSSIAEGNPEGYELEIAPDTARISSPSPRGLFYGAQTLRQLLNENGEAPCVRILDRPRFLWRGFMLDCARHFMPKELVHRVIDLLAALKMNTFHWHLVDDQGWRIEIKKYPRLVEVGAFRDENGERCGGYYSQEDIREVVAYAAARQINVVPEIEMPGHCMSALAAYPHLSSHGNPITVSATWGVFKDVYCAGKDEVFTFLEGVLEEVLELFPSPYIHIGGDEVPKDQWKASAECQKRIADEGLADETALQAWFIARIARFLSARGRTMIGWDEIAEGGAPAGAIVHYWLHDENGKAALAAGHRIISSPHTFTYLNYPLEMTPEWPSWMVALPVEKVYAFDPVPDFAKGSESQIIGAESPLWSEWSPPEKVAGQLLPRLAALAEVLWSPAASRNFSDFQRRVERQSFHAGSKRL
ncbi:beta-N-acetylhexosaminidase [soil metagenome]